MYRDQDDTQGMSVFPYNETTFESFHSLTPFIAGGITVLLVSLAVAGIVRYIRRRHGEAKEKRELRRSERP